MTHKNQIENVIYSLPNLCYLDHSENFNNVQRTEYRLLYKHSEIRLHIKHRMKHRTYLLYSLSCFVNQNGKSEYGIIN